MPRILIAAATLGYQTRSVAEAARRLGVDVVLATDRCHMLENPWLDRAIAVRFEEPRESADLLARELAGSHVDGVIALADAPTTTAAMIAERLGVPFHPADATERCRDKGRARDAFAAAGMLVPRTLRFPLDAETEAARHAEFPCVLKPTALSASRGVIRADDRAGFVAAFGRIRKILESPDAEGDEIQVEQYIPGREFAIEGLMTRGELRVLAIFDKPDRLDGPYFEETLYVTPSREPESVQMAIAGAVRHAVRALGLWHGPVHAEARVNEQGVWMLEAAARPIGGLCARVLQFRGDGCADMTLEDLLVRHAAGRMPEEIALARPASGVMMIPIPRPGIYRGVKGLDAARMTEGIEDAIVAAVAGQFVQPPPEGGSYLGFLFAGGPDAAFVETALRRAHAKLDFEIAGTLDIITR